MIAKNLAGWWIGVALSVGACWLPAQPAQAQTIRYAYDNANRMVQVTAPAGRQAKYFYDASGRQVRTERRLDPVDGVEQTLVTHHKFDPADRAIAIAHVLKRGETERVVAGQAITRLAGGVITRIDTIRSGSYDAETATFSDAPAVTQAFKYNAAASLVEEARTQGGETTVTKYEYDAVGNRLTKEVIAAAGTALTHYTYDRADRLLLESTTLPAGGGHAVSYTWDGNGNLASKTEPNRVTLYRFDPQNRLIDMRTGATQAAAQAAVPMVRYAYDLQGNRVRKWGASGAVTEYLIDSSYAFPQVAMETKGSEAVGYVWGTGLLWQTKYGGMNLENLFPLPGHLGTSLGAVDAKGVLVDSVDHDAYGVLRSVGGLSHTHLYTGEYWDTDSQLLYLRARWYDAPLGRFISADPYQGNASDPRSLNRYLFAHGDPVHNTDPSGLLSASGFLADLSIGSTLRMVSAVGAGSIVKSMATRTLLAIAVAAVGTYHASAKFKTDLEECMDSAKAGDHKCRSQFALYVLGDDHNEVRDHVSQAFSDGKPRSLSRRDPSHDRGWIEKYKKPGMPCNGGPSTNCDEYPWAAAMEGGERGNVSLRSLDASQNKSAGATLRWFHAHCGIPANSPAFKYRVLAVKGVQTGYVCKR